ncbi:MAG TPA: glycosyltransferase, partial [Dehalococcoidia bacterium]|nr:glycosyltransferase [Dehalococcoidia bacterium]
NDQGKSAELIVEKWRAQMKWPLVYEVEPKPGIPFVRNRLLRQTKDAEFIAFIDDDEIADPGWLDELLSIQSIYGAGVVMGPVIPVYDAPPPDWITKGRFHASGRFEDGPTESDLITWNVLIRRNIFDRFNISFDERMALTGGTDVLLGRMLRSVGVKFFWADKALVKEINPPERSRLKWLLLRRFRAGTAGVLILKYSGEPWYRLKSLGIAIKLFLIGTLKALTFIWNGKYAVFKGAGYLCQGLGAVSGLFGFSYQEYKYIHRS